MYFDGASNALGNGIEAILISIYGSHYPFTARLNFDCTNNIVEYKACVMGLHVAVKRNVKTLWVFGDLALVIYKLKAWWKICYSKLINYEKLILELKKILMISVFNPYLEKRTK